MTHLVQAGADLPTVKRISGHKPSRWLSDTLMRMGLIFRPPWTSRKRGWRLH